MTANTTRTTMTHTTKNTIIPMLALAGCLSQAACGPEFDPASLIRTPRVLGARIEVEGAPNRATPMPGETANVTWLFTSPDAPPPLAWTFAVCLPNSAAPDVVGCLGAPLAVFSGTTAPPAVSMNVPSAAELAGATEVVIYGQICAGVDSTPRFDPQSTLPGCTGGRGTTVALTFPLQVGADANYNPAADHAFTIDGQTWPRAQEEPCVAGPRVLAGTQGHVIGGAIEGGDREPYTLLVGDPPVATPKRESIQVSQFTTAGKLKSQFSFVEATDERAPATVEVTWDAPDPAEVPTGGMKVTFTFVTRDNRGGSGWTTRELCVTQQ